MSDPTTAVDAVSDATADDTQLTPEQQSEADIASNNALYAEFLAREQQAAALNDPNTPTDATASTTGDVGEGEDAPDEGASKAPDVPSPGQTDSAAVETDTGADDETSDETPETPDTSSDIPTSIAYRGVEYTPDQMDYIVAAGTWAAQRTPDELQAIDALLSGQYTLVPKQQTPNSLVTPIAPVETPGQQPTTTAQSTAPQSTSFSDLDDDLVDPAVKAHLERMEAELASLRTQTQTQLQSQTEAQLAQQQQQIITQLEAGSAAFQAEHSVSDDELASFQQRVIESQILPVMAQRHPGNPAAAMQAAMNAVALTDPAFQDRIIAQRLEAERQETQAARTRTRKASSLTSSGGSVARVEPPKTKEDNRKQLVAAIESAMSGGQSE